MQSSNEQVVKDVERYLDEKEAMLDVHIDAECDHALFIASYIHGHFSVIAANVMHSVQSPQNQGVTLKQWHCQVQNMLTGSINDAIANNELAQEDAKDVVNMTNMLFVKDNE